MAFKFQPGCKVVGQWHCAFGLIGGITKHDTLISSTNIHLISTNVHATSNVRGLLVDTDKDFTVWAGTPLLSEKFKEKGKIENSACYMDGMLLLNSGEISFLFSCAQSGLEKEIVKGMCHSSQFRPLESTLPKSSTKESKPMFRTAVLTIAS